VLWRSEESLRAAETALGDCWRALSDHTAAQGLDRVAARETAAMLATARWCTAAARARRESRGMHMRADLPMPDPAAAYRLLTGGSDEPWTRYETAAARPTELAA